MVVLSNCAPKFPDAQMPRDPRLRPVRNLRREECPGEILMADAA